MPAWERRVVLCVALYISITLISILLWQARIPDKIRSELGDPRAYATTSRGIRVRWMLPLNARVAVARSRLRRGRRQKMCRAVWAACCYILVRLPTAAAAAAAGTEHHGHHSPLPPAVLTLLPAPPAAPHRERNGHDGHEGHKVHSEGRHEERPGHGGAEGQAGDVLEDGDEAGSSDALEDVEEWSLLQELSEETTQPGFDGLTILLILAAFGGAFTYFVWLERGQAPPMYLGLGRATKGVHARIPTS